MYCPKDVMPNYNFTCQYCGNKWQQYIYSHSIDNIKCDVCKDTNIDYKDVKIETNDQFGYLYKENNKK